MNSYVTVTDQFCGAGGSSLGAAAAGAEIKLALNHWRLAVDTHNTNFPNTDHDCTDVSACDPRRYQSTDILITSPECTNHSLAKGKIRKWRNQLDLFGELKLDPSEERSRATMWDVCRFAEAHHYRIVIVENVVEARHWAPFPAWLQAMELLGYHHHIVYLNSMHAHPTPQSRDRMYVVFWKKSLRRPNLDIRPTAHCARCSRDVAAVQSWKNPRKPWGKYGAQYLYRCPECASEVTPYYYCAANAIDWSLVAPRIGDRARPLREKTLRRIKVGLEKFGRQAILMDYVHTSRQDRHQDMVWTVDRPQRTQLGIHTHALVTPPMLVNFVQSGSENSRATSVEGPWPTQVGNVHHALVTPPFLVDLAYTHGHDRRSVGIDEAAATQTGQQTQALVVPPFIVKLRSDESAEQIDRALSTVTAGGVHHGVLVPPFLTSYNSTSQGAGLDGPVPTQDTRDRHALVVPPFIVSYYTRLTGQQAAVSEISDTLPTVPGRAVHYLAQPGETLVVEDCGFRMLQPHEIGAAMAFPAEYVVLGNQRERVKQYGNAVTPPVLQLIMERCLEVLN